MTQKREHTLIKMVFAAIFIGLLAWAVLLAPVAEAGLPARDTPTPAPVSKDKDKEDNDGSVGAWLELQASGAPAGVWSTVQWQNEADDWYDVEGWQGSLDESAGRRWWVAEKDFGSGPFRWVVTQGKGGSVLGTSQSFYLPAGANETVWVQLTLQ
jgi:hypothetical protein